MLVAYLKEVVFGIVFSEIAIFLEISMKMQHHWLVSQHFLDFQNYSDSLIWSLEKVAERTNTEMRHDMKINDKKKIAKNNQLKLPTKKNRKKIQIHSILLPILQ